MKFAALSAALALVTLVNGMPTAAEPELEIRKKDKTGTCVCAQKEALAKAINPYLTSKQAATHSKKT
jgi:hypothetical protein